MSRPRKPPRLTLRTDTDGRRRYVIRDGQRYARTGCLEGEAEAAASALADYLRQRWRPDTGVRRSSEARLSGILTLYLDAKEETVARPEELRAKIGRLNEFWGSLVVADVRGETCRRYVRQRDARIAARRELETLRAAIRHYAREYGLDVVPLFTLGENHKSRERWLTRQEAAALLRAALCSPHHRHIARFILIGLYTGTRHKAILGLRWMPNTEGGWIDLERGVLYRRGLGEQESNKRRPPARLSPRLMAHLKRWQAKDDNPNGYVINFEGRGLIRIEKGFRWARGKAGLDATVTPHVLRHTRCTWLAQKNVPLWEAAGSVGMTAEQFERTYGHHSPDFQKRAAEAY